MIPLSKAIDALATLGEYEWHTLALSGLDRVDAPVAAAGKLEILLDGEQLVDGAFGEPADLEAYEVLLREIRASAEKYLQSAITGLERELVECGVDPKS